MLDHFSYLRKYFAEGQMNTLKGVCRDKDSMFYGIHPEVWPNQVEASNFFYPVSHFVMAYYLKGYECYRNDAFMEAAELALTQGQRFIHDDGTTDLKMTNFHDPSNNAFIIRDSLGPAVDVMARNSQHTDAENRVEQLLIKTLIKMSKPMETLGFHTPNHRWIICSALSYVYKYTHDEEALNTIGKFLWEGIDCDENGEYTERSAGMYNHQCNISFIKYAYVTGDNSFLEYPIRNMKMMRSYYEPDGSICTMNSMRQDRGSSIGIDVYYDVYLTLALFTGDPEFAYYADMCLRRLMAEEVRVGHPIAYHDARLIYWTFVNDAWEEKWKTIDSYLPDRKTDLYFEKSGIARVFSRNTALTVLRTNQPDFIKFQIGGSSMCVRAGGSFFGVPHAQFRAKTFEKTENGFRLSSTEEAGYRSQFDQPPITSEWRHMDHSLRRIINVRNFTTTFDIVPFDGGFSLDTSYAGDDDIPVKLELTFAPGCRVETDVFVFSARGGDYVYYKGGTVRLRFPTGGVLTIEGGSATHYGGEYLRGTEHVPADCFTLCLTSATPNGFHVRFST